MTHTSAGIEQPDAAPLVPGRWDLCAPLSSARFSVRNLGVRTVAGALPLLDAWVEVDDAGQPAVVHAELDLAGIDTSHAKRDRDLRKPRLLDTERYPILTFDSTALRLLDDRWTMTGVLAGHGAEVELELSAIAHRTGNDAETEAMTVSAAGVLDRRSLGIRAPRFMVGQYVAMNLDVSFTKPS